MTLIQKDKNIRNIEKNLTERALSVTDYGITDATERREWKERIEEASGGRNTVLYNAENMPGVYVRVPATNKEDLDAQFSDGVHPAFIVNGQVQEELLIGKYQAFVANKAGTDYALSLRGVDPATYIDFDESLTANANNGNGFHLMTTAEWSFIHLWSYLNGWEARGNTNDGAHHVRDDEIGRYSREDADRTLTGSGPMPWSHDGSPFGVFYLVGNIREWTGGQRLNEGEIQVIADNDAADNTADHSAVSTDWQAILQDGSLVAPGTADTLKYDATQADGDIELATSIDNDLSVGNDYANNHFRDTVLATGVNVPEIAKLLMIYPHQSDLPTGRYYMRNYGERLPTRGGHWAEGSAAGLSYCSLNSDRGTASATLGCRPAYVAL